MWHLHLLIHLLVIAKDDIWGDDRWNDNVSVLSYRVIVFSHRQLTKPWTLNLEGDAGIYYGSVDCSLEVVSYDRSCMALRRSLHGLHFLLHSQFSLDLAQASAFRGSMAREILISLASSNYQKWLWGKDLHQSAPKIRPTDQNQSQRSCHMRPGYHTPHVRSSVALRAIRLVHGYAIQSGCEKPWQHHGHRNARSTQG